MHTASLELGKNFPNIPVNTDSLLSDFPGADGLALIEVGIGGFGVPHGQLPKGLLDDSRGIILHHLDTPHG